MTPLVQEFGLIGSSLILLIASAIDLRTGEVPEKLTRALVALNLFLGFLAFVSSGSTDFVLQPLFVGAGFFAVGFLFFYLGEWGGGDVKLLAGIGCSLGLLNAIQPITSGIFPFYLTYFINFAMASSPYVICYTLLLGLMRPSVFGAFVGNITKPVSLVLVVLSFFPAAFAFFSGIETIALLCLCIPVLVVLTFYLWSVEKVALQKKVGAAELREGDVVAEDLIVEGRVVARKRDMDGLTKEQLEEVKKLAAAGKVPQEVAVRWGIRFAPVFTLAFFLTVLFGNLLEAFVSALVTGL